MAKAHFEAQKLLDQWATNTSLPISELTASIVRADDAGVQVLSGSKEDVFSIESVQLPSPLNHLQISIYKPSEKRLPLIVYFHGGGFVIGPESYDIPLRALTNTTNCIIARVTCRLAPENPYPAAVKDAKLAYSWLVANSNQLNFDGSQVAIAGDSSGGNLAAVVSQAFKTNEHLCPRFQVLIYPMLDATASTASYETFADGFGFSREKSLWYFEQYLPTHVDRRSPAVSPYWQTDFANLPPTFVATAGCDPLRDEAEVYAERLKLANVPVKLKRYEGMIHGFFQMAGALSSGKELHKDIGLFCREGFQ